MFNCVLQLKILTFVKYYNNQIHDRLKPKDYKIYQSDQQTIFVICDQFIRIKCYILLTEFGSSH